MEDDNEEISHLSLEQQVEALMFLMEGNLADEYQRALEIIPERVRSEAKVSDFLRAEKNDPNKAATRLAKYWKTRKWLFGDRWLLPMNQTGVGTLTPGEVELLRSGYIAIVDSNTEHGVVVVNDSSLLPPGASRYQPRIAFYCFTTCRCDMTALIVVRGGPQPSMNVNGTIKHVLEATPMGVKNMYVAQAYQPGREHLLDFLGYKQRKFTEANSGRRFAAHIAANSLGATYQLLEQHGFDRHCLPPELGGQMDHSAVNKWVRMRLSLEDIMSAAPIGRDSDRGLVPVTSTAVSKGEGKHQKRSTTQREREALIIVRRPNETDKEFAKRKNACYVRRNYHRQKIERIAAEGEVKRYRSLNESLKIENRRLEQLLEESQKLVRIIENCDTIGAFPVRSQDITEPKVEREDGSDEDSAFASILLTADEMDIEQANCR
mmetsp:Transcript_14928/g.28508  ORF Transcript_14928/g.28508 Transcript_14928/m.28508 type:complete len:434 (-) Transcript_14928:100-1401(-)|eukprot:scaffold2094_cov146-Amphora_coffeaeformis.AAC.3